MIFGQKSAEPRLGVMLHEQRARWNGRPDIVIQGCAQAKRDENNLEISIRLLLRRELRNVLIKARLVCEADTIVLRKNCA